MVDAVGRRYGVTYPWAPEAIRVAERMDFVARAGDLARVGQPALRLIVVIVPGMEHALAEEPGIAPAPQTVAAAVVDQHTTTWLRSHLPGCTTSSG